MAHQHMDIDPGRDQIENFQRKRNAEGAEHEQSIPQQAFVYVVLQIKHCREYEQHQQRERQRQTHPAVERQYLGRPERGAKVLKNEQQPVFDLDKAGYGTVVNALIRT